MVCCGGCNPTAPGVYEPLRQRAGCHAEGGTLTIEGENLTVDEVCSTMYSKVSPGQYVVITVSDTGTGMTPEVMNRIF